MHKRSRVGRRLAFGALLAALLVSSRGRQALASDPSSEKGVRSGAENAISRLIGEALDRYSVADFAGAVSLLERALAGAPPGRQTAQIHFHLGINHHQLGNAERAASHFRSALRADPLLEGDPRRFKKETMELFNRVKASLSGRLAVIANVAGAQVLVDGRSEGQSPHRGAYRIGAHRVVVRASDGRSAARRVIVRVAQQTTVRIALPSVSAAPVAAPGAASDRPPLGSQRRRRPRDTDRRPARIWTWVVAGLAAAAMGAGIGLGVAAKHDHDEWVDRQQGPPDPAGREALADSGKAKQLAANVLFGVAGAALVGAVTLFFLEGRSPRQRGKSTADSKARVIIRSPASVTVRF